MASKPAREMRPGDWICPSCANHNFADKLFCNRCNHPKEKAGEVPGSGPDLQPPTQAWRFRQGDWMCPACGNHNYSSRTACNRCNAPRPSGSDEATSLKIVPVFLCRLPESYPLQQSGFKSVARFNTFRSSQVNDPRGQERERVEIEQKLKQGLTLSQVSGSYGAAPKGGPKRESPYQAPGFTILCPNECLGCTSV